MTSQLNVISVHVHSISSHIEPIHWLSNQRLSMKNNSFEKRLKTEIYDTFYDDRLLHMYQIIIYSGFMIKYNVVDMFLRFKDKYAWCDLMDLFMYNL